MEKTDTREPEVNKCISGANSPQLSIFENHQDSQCSTESYRLLPPQQNLQFPISALEELINAEDELIGSDTTSVLSKQKCDQKTFKNSERLVNISQFPRASELPNVPVQTVNVHVASSPLVSLTKHIPVVQVSSYVSKKTTIRRTKSDNKIRNKCFLQMPCKSSSVTQTQAVKDSIETPSVKVKLEPDGTVWPVRPVSKSNTTSEEQLSPGSREMLAVNVLVEGFAKEET